MNSDFKELLQIFAEENVKYLVVGGYAVIHHSQPRYTKDIDLWIEPSVKNSHALAKAFLRFGLPMEGIEISDFATPGTQFFIGVPPCAFDFLTTIPGLNFEDCWLNRDTSHQDNYSVHYLGKADLLVAKETAGRPQDLADIDEISRADS